jgi:hypothetical protein
MQEENAAIVVRTKPKYDKYFFMMLMLLKNIESVDIGLVGHLNYLIDTQLLQGNVLSFALTHG